MVLNQVSLRRGLGNSGVYHYQYRYQ